MDATEVKDRLANQAEAVCQHLLPSGKRRGRQWCVGGLNNEPGDSLVIEVEGAKLGKWSDFASGEKGGSNLLELWRAKRDCDFATAFREACEWLGVSPEGPAAVFHAKPAAEQPIVALKADFVPLRAAGPALRYLTSKRGISEATLELYQVAETERGGGYVFPSYTADGSRLEMWKSIALTRTDKGKKQVRTSAGTAKCLFGKHATAGHCGTLVITEGEIDALSVAEIGGFAVSVPYGAKGETTDGKSPNDAWIEHDWNWLQQFTVIVLCFDADDEGQKAAQAVLKRLGRERCRIVEMPGDCKDANDCLRAGKRADLGAAIENARSIDPVELRGADQYRDAVWDRMHPPGGVEPGIPFFLSIPFRVRPGELTIWSGFNGSGKSVLLTQLAVYLASKNERTCIGSFEMPPAHTLQIAVRQAANVHQIGERKRFETVMDWLARSIWLFDRDGLKDWREMVDVFTYARRRYDIRHFIVDSLAKCGIDSDNYNEQKRFVDTLVTWAKKEGVHVHVVAHLKKAGSEKDAGGKMDVKGASEITDLAWNVASIWRNKAKEEALWAALHKVDQNEYNEVAKIIDGKLSFSKQRETGDEPWVEIFFDRDSMRFRSTRQNNEQAFV